MPIFFLCIVVAAFISVMSSSSILPNILLILFLSLWFWELNLGLSTELHSQPFNFFFFSKTSSHLVAKFPRLGPILQSFPECGIRGVCQHVGVAFELGHGRTQTCGSQEKSCVSKELFSKKNPHVLSLEVATKSNQNWCQQANTRPQLFE